MSYPSTRQACDYKVGRLMLPAKPLTALFLKCCGWVCIAVQLLFYLITSKPHFPPTLPPPIILLLEKNRTKFTSKDQSLFFLQMVSFGRLCSTVIYSRVHVSSIPAMLGKGGSTNALGWTCSLRLSPRTQALQLTAATLPCSKFFFLSAA